MRKRSFLEIGPGGPQAFMNGPGGALLIAVLWGILAGLDIAAAFIERHQPFNLIGGIVCVAMAVIFARKFFTERNGRLG